MRMTRIPWTVLILLLAVSAAQTARAQDDPAYQIATQPYASYNGGKLDQVDLFSGNLSVNIPLISYPQKGGKLKLDFVLSYHSGPALVTETCDSQGNCTTYAPNFHHGWQVTLEGTGGLTYVTNAVVGGGNASDFDDYAYETANGVHQLAPISTANFGSSTTWRAIDGSGYLVNCTSNCSSYTVIDPNGVQYTYGGSAFPSTITDLNGNNIPYSGTSGWVDTLNRNIPLPPGTPLFPNDTPTTADPNVCPSVPSQPSASSSYIWSPPGFNGGTYPVKFCYFTYDESYSYFDPTYGWEYGGGEIQELQSVVLPDGTAWTFQYSTDGMADLTKITFPTGGTIAYGWTSMANGPDVCNAYLCVGDIVASRETDPGNGGASGQWGYGYSTSGTPPNVIYTTTVTDPTINDVSNKQVYTFTSLDYQSPYETEAQYYQGTGTLLKTVSTTYSYSTPFDGNTNWPLYGYAVNAVPTQVTTTWAATGQTSRVSHSYDMLGSFYWPNYLNNNQYNASTTPWTGTLGVETAKNEYGYGGSLVRSTATTYVFQSNSNYLDANLMNLPSSVHVTGTGPGALTNYGYDASGSGCSSGTCGDLSSISRWLNTTGGYLSTTNTYNSSGDLATSKDPNGNQTMYTYGSGYAGSGPTAVTNPLGRVRCYTYDANTGLLTSMTILVASADDCASSPTTTYSHDLMLRTTEIDYPDGGKTTFGYGTPSGGETDVQVQQKIDNNGHEKTSTVVVDGFGREVQTQLTSDPEGTDTVDTTYDGMGRVASVSNPYRSTSDPTYGITQYQYDAFGRPTLVTEPDNSTISTSYSGPCATVTDEAGKMRKSCSDALGRLAEVVEDPNGAGYGTTYSYDALDNRTAVDEDGQTRSFTYDSLSRLTNATNPESGTTAYSYDADGNVITKTDARGIVTCFGTWNGTTCNSTNGYDSVNRPLNISYSDSTPTVTYSYGQGSCLGLSACYNIGHRTGMTDVAGSESWAYDPMGRVLADKRTTNSVTENTSYTYDTLGSLKTLTYPDGRVITYTPDLAGRPSTAQDTTDGINLAWGACSNVNGEAGVCYTPQGALASMVNGAKLTSSFYYNSRLQPCRISVLSSGSPATSCTDSQHIGNVFDLTYNLNAGSGDNGSVLGTTNGLNNNRNETMTYDPLNRILSAQTQASSGQDCWSDVFGTGGLADDPLGNLLQAAPSKCTGMNLSLVVNGNNWITSPTGFQYDAAGNMTAGSGASYAYNAENELTNFDNGSVTYTYDGNGQRVEKSDGTLYWYGPGGNVLYESDASGTNEYIYFDGRRIARLAVAVH